jgi:dolichol-phosphate mannosyltransferase
MTAMNASRVTIIIPAKNEASNIGPLIERLRGLGCGMLVVDGNSTDGTAEKCSALGLSVFRDHGRGKGDALRVGAANAPGEVLVFMDADLSHDPADIEKLVTGIEQGADLVIGSRMKGGSDELHGTLDNFIRNTGSNLLCLILNYRFGVMLTDIENGFRAIRKDVFLDLGLSEDGFTVEQEMVIRALKKGRRIVEVPSHEFERSSGKSKLPTREGWKFLYYFFKDLVF